MYGMLYNKLFSYEFNLQNIQKNAGLSKNSLFQLKQMRPVWCTACSGSRISSICFVSLAVIVQDVVTPVKA